MDLITPQCIEGTLGIFIGLFVDLMGLEESQKAFAMVLPGKTGHTINIKALQLHNK